jgi:GT2 family glycosyltransferase
MEQILISIISTNQSHLVEKLCADLLKNKIKLKIVVTLNGKNENVGALSKFKKNLNINFIKNREIKGFANNHNKVFKMYKSKYFLILNPDLRIKTIDLDMLKKNLISNSNIKLISPQIFDSQILNYGNFRQFPKLITPLIRLLIINRPFKYNFKKITNYVDWISGAFMFIESNFLKKINYFDEKYYLYYEDVDLCKRVNIDHKKTAINKSLNNKIIHFSRRDSHKKFKYFLYHIKSYIYYHYKFKDF